MSTIRGKRCPCCSAKISKMDYIFKKKIEDDTMFIFCWQCNNKIIIKKHSTKGHVAMQIFYILIGIFTGFAVLFSTSEYIYDLVIILIAFSAIISTIDYMAASLECDDGA